MTLIQIRQDQPLAPLNRRPRLVWLSPHRQIFGFGVGVRFDPGVGTERYARAARLVEEWWESIGPIGPGPGPLSFASFTFDSEVWGSVIEVPALSVIETSDEVWTVSLPGAELPPPETPLQTSADRPRFAGSSLPDHLWLQAVVEGLDLIHRRELEKVVLARDHALWSKRPFDPRLVLHRLWERFPDCYIFMIDGLVGASPELLINRHGLQVTSRVLAGSAPRRSDPAEDALIGKELLSSPKNLHEHALAAASVSEVLADLCDRFDQPGSPELLQLANVQHLSTLLQGRLRRPHHVLELVGALHPTAAVGGTPAGAALATIRRLEGMNRGRYAGPVGCFDPNGEGEFALALRCAELSGARARLFAGAGIVDGSVPEEELEETRLKLRAMLSALE